MNLQGHFSSSFQICLVGSALARSSRVRNFVWGRFGHTYLVSVYSYTTIETEYGNWQNRPFGQRGANQLLNLDTFYWKVPMGSKTLPTGTDVQIKYELRLFQIWILSCLSRESEQSSSRLHRDGWKARIGPSRYVEILSISLARSWWPLWASSSSWLRQIYEAPLVKTFGSLAYDIVRTHHHVSHTFSHLNWSFRGLLQIAPETSGEYFLQASYHFSRIMGRTLYPSKSSQLHELWRLKTLSDTKDNAARNRSLATTRLSCVFTLENINGTEERRTHYIPLAARVQTSIEVYVIEEEKICDVWESTICTDSSKHMGRILHESAGHASQEFISQNKPTYNWPEGFKGVR